MSSPRSSKSQSPKSTKTRSLPSFDSSDSSKKEVVVPQNAKNPVIVTRGSSSSSKSLKQRVIVPRNVNSHPSSVTPPFLKSSSNPNSESSARTDEYSYYYSDAGQHRVAFPGYPAFFKLENILESKTHRTWCHGSPKDHGDCLKAHLRCKSSSSNSKKQVEPTPVIKNRSNSDSSKSSISETSKKAQLKLSLSAISKESNNSSISGNKPKLTTRAVTSSSSSKSYAKPKKVAHSPGFTHIHRNGYWVDELNVEYKSANQGKSSGLEEGHGALETHGAHGVNLREKPFTAEINEEMRSPRNTFKRDNFRVGKAPPKNFWGSKSPPPMPTTEDPYQHLRTHKVRNVRAPIKEKPKENPIANILAPHHAHSGENLLGH